MTTTNIGYFGGCTGYTWAYNHSDRDGNFGLTAPWFLPGGTGNQYPSEYGVFSYDEHSAAAGVSATVQHRDYLIPIVSLNDTFESWRTKTNDEIIEKLNLLKVYGTTAGDGLMVGVSTGGTAAYAFSGNVLRTTSTFCNNVYIGKSLKVGDATIGGTANPGKIEGNFNVNESIVVLNHNEAGDSIGDYSGLIIGGFATGPDPASIGLLEDESASADPDDAFVFDRPYWIHKNNMWRTKEGLWLEGKLIHNQVFCGTTGGSEGPAGTYRFGSTGGDYPSGPYGYTGSTNDYDNRFFTEDTDYAEGGVVRIFFGPTLAGSNFLDIDGRNGVSGVTGQAWRGVKGVTGALVVGNTAGGLLEFEDTGYVNIYKGANKKRVTKTDHGFTFGHCLRYDAVNGYTYASAAGDFETESGDGIVAADALGMVSKYVDKDTFDITFLGEIEDSRNSAWNDITIESAASGLTPGKVYFLTVSNAVADQGKITSTEPIVTGNINKPMMIATGTNSGIVLNYRGQYNNPTGCSGGATGAEAIFFQNTYTHGSDPAFAQGNLVTYDTTDGNPSGLKLASNLDISTSHVIGMVSFIDTTLGYMEITTQGTVILGSNFTNFENPGTYFLGSNGNPTQTQEGSLSVKVFDALSGTKIIMNPDSPDFVTNPMGAGDTRQRGAEPAQPGLALNLLGPTGATGFTYDNAERVNRNFITNPDFGIWQRGLGTTGASGHTGTDHTYFADRWLRVSQTGTGYHDGNPLIMELYGTGASSGTHRTFDYMLRRDDFDRKQIDVEGHPIYYATVRGKINFHGGTNSNEYCKVEQRFSDVTSHAGNIMTASFYAKGGSTGTCHLAWTQNLTGTTGCVPGATGQDALDARGITANEIITPITDFQVTPNWQKYQYAFFVPEISNESGASGSNHGITHGFSGDHFSSLGIYTQLTSLPNGTEKNIYFNHNLHLSQVKLERSNFSTLFDTVDEKEELKKCKEFYQTSYDYGDIPGTSTIQNGLPNASGIHFIVPASRSHIHQFDQSMRKTPGSCTLYSPSGIINEGFNADIGRDLRFAAGTTDILGINRTNNANAENIGCTSGSPAGLRIDVFYGANPLDNVVVHYVADAEYNNALPTEVSESID
jgi:hypothetical protein